MDEKLEDKAQIVHSQVTAALKGQEVRELWHKLRNDLTRKGGGPDACVAYLESELTRMEEQVRRALE